MKYLIIALLFIISCTENSKNKDNFVGRNSNKIEERKSIHQQEWEKYNKQNSADEMSNKSFNIKVENIYEITSKNLGEFNSPKFTPDGKYIIFTNSNFGELWHYSIETGNLTKLISLPKCGYKFQISENGGDIYFRTRDTKEKRSGGDYAIYKINIENKKLSKLYSSSNYLSSPVLIDHHLYLLKDENPICIDLSTLKEIKYFPQPFFYVNNNKLFRQKESLKIVYEEVKVIDCNYSKDKKYIFTLTSAKGIIIFDLEAKIINRFPKAKSLTNLASSNLVLFTQEQDEGQRTVSSKLFMGFLNSKKISEVNFNKHELIFNPDWSPVDNKIVYTNDNGIVKILSFKIESE